MSVRQFALSVRCGSLNETTVRAFNNFFQCRFIIEGLATVLIAMVSPWMLDDFPEDTKFLTPPEKAFVIQRLKEDQGAAGEAPFAWAHLFSAATDWVRPVPTAAKAGCRRACTSTASLGLHIYVLCVDGFRSAKFLLKPLHSSLGSGVSLCVNLC